MAASKAELWSQLTKAIDIIDHLYTQCATESTNLAGLIDTLQQAYEGSHIQSTESGVASLRSSVSSAISSSTAILTPIILELAQVGYSSTATSVSAALDDIAAGLDSDTETILERDFTYASASAGGSNVGTGQVFRVLQDQYGKPLESSFGGTVRWECTSDVDTGSSSGAEQGLIYGVGIAKVDEIAVGTKTNASNTSLAVNTTNKISTQASFNVDVIGSLTDWTIDSGSPVIDTSNYHRPAASNPGSLKIPGDASISRTISSASLDTSKPLVMIVSYNRETGSGDGTLTLSLGSQTEAVAMSAQTGWNFHSIGTGASSKGWYSVFKESGNGIDIGIALSSWSTGYVLVDDVWLVQPTLFDGVYYVVVPGATDFQVGDIISFADTVDNDGRYQYWISRLYGKSLPSETSSPTYPA